MIIAVDFDGTYAADPNTFSSVVDMFQSAGHTCIMVTQRSDEYTWGNEVRQVLHESGHPLMPIVFASGMTKNEAATQAGFSVDVWIDDNPYGIYEPLVYIGAK